MALVFAGITPHPPLLLPTIGKDSLKKVEQTKKAMEQLEEDLYLTRPDVVVIISPHGSVFNDAFTININPEYVTDLKEFGDLSTKLKFKGEMNLSSYLRENSKDKKYPTAVISEPNLDHGSSVPLFFLMQHLPNTTILPIGFSDLDWKTHTDFGYMLKQTIAQSTKRVAVIASGDLSHCLVTDAPAGFNAAGEKFDHTLRELLSTGNTSGMLQLDSQFVGDACECGFRSFLILMGVLRNMKHGYKEYSYECPFGVGYMVSNFTI